MSALRNRLPAQADDRGIAVITVLLVGTLMSILAVSTLSISTGNLKNAGRDRVAGGALGAAEAGLAQAVNHMRVASLACLSGAPACVTPDPWASATGVEVALPDGRKAQVKITVVQPLKLPTVKTARFSITSTGRAGSGPGLRVAKQEVTLKPLDFPLSVYANQIQLTGTPSTFQQSVLSKNCIGGREKMSFKDPATGANAIDAAYGIPAAAHSEDAIYEKTCPGKNTDRIHHSSTCNPLYPYDQDKLGGPKPDGSGTLPSPCLGAGGAYPQTSYFGPGDVEKFGATDITPLLPALKAQAASMNQYWTSATGWTPPNPGIYPHAVIYFKLGKDQTLSLQSELDGYLYDCAAPKSVVIVVEHEGVGSGGLHMNSNNALAGAIFVPRGNFQYNGGASFTGPIFANTIDKWNGNAKSQLTQCYLDNFPPGLLDLGIEDYREVDTAS